jgi:cyclopropane-fatty-acyl-phospholipid synthase
MFDNFFRKQLERILEPADIMIDGSRPWDIRIRNPVVYRRAVTEANFGLGETYMAGYWECDALDECFFRLLSSKADERVLSPATILGRYAGMLFNLQNPSRSFMVGERHYNTGNDLFEAMLDKMMNYSCGYWKEAKNLDEAQEHKLHLVFEKLMLQPGMNILDIGCGWGGAARYAAEHYGVSVTGITVSSEQAELSRERCRGLPVTIELIDYRKLVGSFDRIYSIGMFEHVGYKNYRTYFNMVQRCLKPGGLTLLHTIGGNLPCSSVDPWVCKYIFPNSMIPSASQITTAYEELFTLEDWHVFTWDYAITLKTWNDNFERFWPSLRSRYSEEFHRMWRYYLLSCSGAFRARFIQLWQVLLSRDGIKKLTNIPR